MDFMLFKVSEESEMPSVYEGTIQECSKAQKYVPFSNNNETMKSYRKL